VLVATAGAAALLWALPRAGAAPEGDPGAVRASQEAKVELGRRLFFDPVASRSGARSCASCHDPEHGFSDTQTSSDDDVLITLRHSQTLIDSHRNPTAHWDGQFASIEELVFARLDLVDGVKGRFGLGTSTGGGGYGPPPPPPPPTVSPRSAPAPETDEDEPADPPPADKPPVTPGDAAGGHAGGAKEPGKAPDAVPQNPDASSAAKKPGEPDVRARRGRLAVKVLPLDLTRLPSVSQTIERSGRYEDGFRAAFGNTSVTTARMAEAIAAYCRTLESQEAPIDRHIAGRREALSPAAKRGLALFQGRAGCAQCHVMEGQHPAFTDFRFHNTGIAWRAREQGGAPGADEAAALERSDIDPGREHFSRSTADRHAFKTATLRDLPRRGPYMHSGAFDTLAAVVRHYAHGGSKDPRQDARIRPFEATDSDVADLVAFLEALNGEARPGLPTTLGPARAERTRVRLVDARQRPLANWTLDLVPEGDCLPGPADLRDRVRTVTTDAAGTFEFSPGLRTHMRLALPDLLVPVGGALVPDTCRQVTVVVPIDGRVALVVAFGTGVEAPARLVAEHEGTMRLPGHTPPRTVFDRVAALEVGGRKAVSYEGWLRTDVPPEVVVRVPGDRRAWPDHRLRLTDSRTLKLDLEE
jgi:cytochrome c peroxidase